MGTCIINYKKQSFGVGTAHIEIVMSYMSEIINVNAFYNQPWLKKYDEEILVGKMGYFVNLLNFNFDVYLSNRDRVKVFTTIINETKIKFKNINLITYDEIQERQKKGLLDPEEIWIENAFPFRIDGYLFLLDRINDVINERLDNDYNRKTIYLKEHGL